ncbi:hypothetical protein [Curtobacterium sp. Leaf261]|uniref:hypothetical protein n=1 Tax=Curtobacterium sp. Leaf261 TaxID=1736311 RepID=UPI0006F3E033|nr:hypothetical protein [Curtobacterium sp. Leaf261]KQO59999.1 hypothetical protein ASF23_15220 [Curtobacterium sp. Leaf261]
MTSDAALGRGSLGPASSAVLGRRRVVGVVAIVEAVVLLVVALLGDRITRPVTVTLGNTATRTLSHVDLGIAMVVVVGLVGVAGVIPRRWAGAVDPLLTTPITVFVVAQANGVRDIGALVGVYALASAGVLFAVVQERARRRADGPRSRVPLGLGSAVGIVPWGIIALHQVGAGFVGHPLPGAVVLVTLAALVFAIGEFVATWRDRGPAAFVLRAVGLSVVAWLVVLAL